MASSLTSKLKLFKPTPGTNEQFRASDFNSNMDKIDAGGNGLFVCTSTTRPASPFEGMTIYETDTNRKYLWTGTKWLFDGGVIPIVSVRRTTNGPTWESAIWVAIPWESILANETTVSSMWTNTNPSRLVAPIDGIYLAIGQAGLDKPNTGGDWYVGFKRASDGAIFRGSSLNRPTNAPGEAEAVAEIYLAANDYVEFVGYSTTVNSFVRAQTEVGPYASLQLITAKA